MCFTSHYVLILEEIIISSWPNVKSNWSHCQEALISSRLMLTTMPWPMQRRQWLCIVVVGTTPLSLSIVDKGSAVLGHARLRGQLFVPQETVWEHVRSPLIKKHRRHQQQQGAYYHPQQNHLKLIDIAIPHARWKVNRINTAVSTLNVWRNDQDSVPGLTTSQVM